MSDSPHDEGIDFDTGQPLYARESDAQLTAEEQCVSGITRKGAACKPRETTSRVLSHTQVELDIHVRARSKRRRTGGGPPPLQWPATHVSPKGHFLLPPKGLLGSGPHAAPPPAGGGVGLPPALHAAVN